MDDERSETLRDPLIDPVGDDSISAPEPDSTSPGSYSRVAVAVLGLVTLADAVEYGLIMPSLYGYILEAGSHQAPERVQQVFGAALSSFSASSFVAKPIFGFLVDRLLYRTVYLGSILIAIAGNLLYANAGHRHAIWMIIVGRTLSGIGCANTTLSYSYVSRTVPERSRTAVMTVLGMSFPIGLVLGPGMNALTAQANFTALGLPITPSNAPGVLIALVLALLLTAIIVFLPEPPPYATEPSREKSTHIRTLAASLGREVAHPAIARCVYTIFLFNLYITAVEALVVPVTKHAFGFGTLQNSFVYLGTAIEVLVLSIVVMFASRKFSDDVLVMISCVCATGSLVFTLTSWRYDMGVGLFIVGEAMMVTSIPFAFAPNRSRFSKLTAGSHNQGLLQSMMSSVASIGSIVGPVYLSALIGLPVEHGRIAVRMFAGLALLSGLLLCWEIAAYAAKRLNVGGTPEPRRQPARAAAGPVATSEAASSQHEDGSTAPLPLSGTADEPAAEPAAVCHAAALEAHNADPPTDGTPPAPDV